MKRKLLALFLVMTMALTACGEATDKPTDIKPDTTSNDTENPEEVAEEDGGSWAVYWYLCGSDLESENGFATEDLNEMMKVTLPENVTFVIQTGGASEWQNETISADSINRFVYKGDSLEQVDELEQANMGDPDTLVDFLSFCNENYPADHKMVLFWDHGGGTPSGAALDENYDSDSLTLPELRKAFESTCEPSAENQPYDIIGFDTCLMATIDVASIFKDIGKYLVASEETEPGIGWCYDGWVKTFAENDKINTVDLCKNICDTYYKACEENELAEEVTLSVTDLSKVSAVEEAYSAFGDEALMNMLSDDTFYAKYDRYAKKAQNYGGNTDKSGYSDMADLGDLVNKSKKIMPSSSDALESALSDAVVYQVMGDYRKKASGLSCYYPYSYDTDLYKGYHKATATKSFDYYYQYLLKDKFSDKGLEYISNLIDGAEVSEKPTVGKKDLEDHKVNITDDNVAELNLGPDVANLLSSVYYSLYLIDGDTYIYLGTNDNLEYDWENGVFRDAYDGTWGAIDGNPVYMEVSESTDEYTIFSIPIKLNKKRCILDCAINNSTLEGSILGVKSGMDNGVSAKDYKKLKVGDKITTLVNYTSDATGGEVEEVELDKITVTEDTNFSMTDLGDGTYGFMFEMMTADGKEYSSDAEVFKFKNGTLEFI